MGNFTPLHLSLSPSNRASPDAHKYLSMEFRTGNGPSLHGNIEREHVIQYFVAVLHNHLADERGSLETNVQAQQVAHVHLLSKALREALDALDEDGAAEPLYTRLSCIHDMANAVTTTFDRLATDNGRFVCPKTEKEFALRDLPTIYPLDTFRDPQTSAPLKSPHPLYRTDDAIDGTGQPYQLTWDFAEWERKYLETHPLPPDLDDYPWSNNTHLIQATPAQD